MLGAPSWGIMADKYGRRPTLVWATVFLFWYGTLTSASPSFGWVLALRFFVGVFIGAVPQVSLFKAIQNKFDLKCLNQYRISYKNYT